jgi:hypothetical protein
MSEDNEISKETLYKTVLETRNLEISLFWQRSNYFLGLNTVVAVGFFSLKDPVYITLLSLFGFVGSILWFCTTLGGKFWQSRWEERLRLVEQELSPEIQFFSADWDTIYKDVEEHLTLANHSRFRQFFDRLVLRKPSVSFAMILLSLIFALLWLVLLVVAFLRLINVLPSP